ncbi:DUF4153 domain-containing protein [Streptomyces sp. NPDC087850]|uniref:DUF4153 domain-containing protein n=1 Tax=Streptomyces sp. NPDC087850 TaxID=3365809 RepID=UPI0038049CC2
MPRAVAASAGAAVLTFGLISPDAVVAERNVQRYERLHTMGIPYLQDLPADAVQALDRLPEPLRSCALAGVERNLTGDKPRYATSWSKHRARELLAKRKADATVSSC